MAGRLLEEPAAIHHGAALHIFSPEHKSPDPGVADRSGAHRARLQGDGEGQPDQAIVADPLRRAAHGQDFGVGGWVMRIDRRVRCLGDDLACRRIEHHGADRNLPGVRGGLRLLQGEAHHCEVMVDHSRQRTAPASSGQADGVQAGERVAKRLARAGVASRREIERLIEAGRVALNGQVLTSPAINVGANDILTVDGKVAEDAEPTRVFRYHKPSGLVTTHVDPKGRPTVFSALPPGLPRVISVGRLDLNSEGLLLLTNDGELSRALELPSSDWVRIYRARARGRVDQARLDTLKDGITVEGVRYGPIEASLDKAKEGPRGANLWLTLSLTEGKNREVRRGAGGARPDRKPPHPRGLWAVRPWNPGARRGRGNRSPRAA